MLKKISRQKLLLFFVDVLLIVLSVNLAYIVRVNSSIISYLGLNKGLVTIVLILAIYLLSFYIFDFYTIRGKFRYTRFLANIAGALISVSLISVGLFYAFPFVIGRGVFLISLIIAGVFIHTWRLFYFIFFRHALPKKGILIIGTGKSAEAVYSLLKKNPEYKITGFIGRSSSKNEFLEKKIIGGFSSLRNIVNQYKIDDIIIATEAIQNKKNNKILIDCKMKGINIWDIPAFYEQFFNKLPVQYIKESWFLSASGFEKLSSNIYRRLKRIMDFLISFLILLSTLPFSVLIALLVKLDSKGPVFFIQDRMGENQKNFNLLKFRTMVSDAEKDEPMWAKEDDPRVTRVGKILRKTRLDEIPQFINIIKGEMSLIGPRPEREYFVKKLMEKIPYYSLRFSVKPGLTGWAQVTYKYGDSVDDALEKLQYELYYVKNMSLALDIRILLKTIRIVLFGMGR